MNWQTGEPTEWAKYICTVEFDPEYEAENDIEMCFFTVHREWLWDDSRLPLGKAKVLAWIPVPPIYEAKPTDSQPSKKKTGASDA